MTFDTAESHHRDGCAPCVMTPSSAPMDSHRPPPSDPEAPNDRSRSWIALAIPLAIPLILGLAVLVWIAVLA